MARKEFSVKTGPRLICAKCRAPFYRKYRISERRAEKPQYCSRRCQSALLADLAAARLVNRFWNYVQKNGPDECWPWIGDIGNTGYGRFGWKRPGVNKRTYLAPRVAYELATGHPPGDLLVCHKCDNRKCCNPAHLWLGTHRENMRDMALKGRQPGPTWKGESHPCAKLKLIDVLAIRASAKPRSVLAEEYGVTGTAIYNIRARITWRHV